VEIPLLKEGKKVSVASVADGLMVEMLPAVPVVDDRLPSVDRRSKAQWQMVPTTTERPFSRSRGNTQDYPGPVITYENVCFKKSSHYSTMLTQYFNKGMIIDVWV
jgi:hypothetical protein